MSYCTTFRNTTYEYVKSVARESVMECIEGIAPEFDFGFELDLDEDGCYGCEDEDEDEVDDEDWNGEED